MHYQETVAYKFGQARIEKVTASSLRGYYISYFEEIRRKKSFSLTGNWTRNCLFWTKTHMLLLKHSGSIAPEWKRIICLRNIVRAKHCRKHERKNCVTLKEYVACLQKQKLNYMKCVCRVKQLVRVWLVDGQKIWTRFWVRMNGRPHICQNTLSRYVLESSIPSTMLALQLRQHRWFCRLTIVKLTTLIDDWKWGHPLLAICFK